MNPRLAATTVPIWCGTTDSYGSSTTESAVIGADESQHSVSRTLNGLTPDTLYHYRVVGTNSIASDLGEEQTFKTSPTKSEAEAACREVQEGLRHEPRQVRQEAEEA